MAEPRLDQNKPEYPTDEQMTTMFNAWKKGGEAGILEVLRPARSQPKDKEQKG
jgi:hypothetical protein